MKRVLNAARAQDRSIDPLRPVLIALLLVIPCRADERPADFYVSPAGKGLKRGHP
jgi:hypothetical protein